MLYVKKQKNLSTHFHFSPSKDLSNGEKNATIKTLINLQGVVSHGKTH